MGIKGGKALKRKLVKDGWGRKGEWFYRRIGMLGGAATAKKWERRPIGGTAAFQLVNRETGELGAVVCAPAWLKEKLAQNRAREERERIEF